MNEMNHCPNCGAAVPPDAPQGLCPKCVLADAASMPTRPSPGGGAHPAPPVETIRSAFPQFEMLELLGAGGMGAVYKARQPKLDRLVAVKVLPASLAAEPGFADRFAREARLLARLSHPNIVGVFDFGQANGLFYLVMEYVDGLNLRQAMQAGRFSPAAALAIVPQICDALQYAHGEGILHRDIKPENILLDTKGRVKIADFGIAKLVRPEENPEALTSAGAAVGTPHYMAPEQLEKPQEVDQRADIYSLGVVFYELLTGELPIGRFALPSEKSAVDPRVDPIVLKALEKEKERRYRNVGEVKTSVQQLAASPAPPPSAPPLVHPQPSRTARGATASFVLTLVSFLPGLVILFATWFAVTAFRVSGEASAPVAVASAELLLVVVFAALGLPGFALGVWALADIRASGGALRGVSRALFGALAWPALILVGASCYLLAGVFGGFIPNSPGFAWRLGCITLLGAAAAAGFLTLARRFVLGQSAQAAGSWLFFLLLIPLLAPPATFAAFVSGAIVAHRSVVSHSPARVDRPTSIQSAALADDPSFPADRARGSLSAEFAIPQGHGVIAELVVMDGGGQKVMTGSELFLLASPSQEARRVVSWVPAPEPGQAGGTSYQSVVREADPLTARTNEPTRFVVPSAAAKLVRNQVVHMSVGRLGSGPQEVHWFVQRNGPEPGLGVSLRMFPHSLSGDLIADGGYCGFGTNWLQQVQQ